MVIFVSMYVQVHAHMLEVVNNRERLVIMHPACKTYVYICICIYIIYTYTDTEIHEAVACPQLGELLVRSLPLAVPGHIGDPAGVAYYQDPCI